MSAFDARILASRAVALLVAVAIVCRVAGLGAGWLPPTALLLLLLGVAHGAERLVRARQPLALGRLARGHTFVIGLAALVALTLLVRVPGLTADLGHVPLDIDENRLASNVQHFFVTGELGHETVEHYPGVAFWLFAGGAFLRFMRGLSAGLVTTPAHLPVTEYVAAARIANVFVAVGLVWLTAAIGRRIGGLWAGLFAGALGAIAPLSVDTTTVCRCDPVMLLAVLGAVQLALVAEERGLARWYVAAGAVAGVATGVKYSAVFAIAPVLLATLALPSWRASLKAAAAAFAAFVGAIAISNHFVWYDFPNFLIQLTRQVAITGAGHWAATAHPAGFYIAILDEFGPGTGLTLIAAAFAVVTLATRRLSWWILMSFPFLYFGFMTSRPSQLPRWVYPLLPFAAVASCALVAIAIGSLRQAVARGSQVARGVRWALVVIVAALLVSPVWAGTISFTRRLATPTHVLAEQWLRERVPPGAVVVIGRGWLDLTGLSMNVRRVEDLKKTLDGGVDALAGAQFVVVPEPYFNHPTLRQLGFLDRIHTEWRVGSSAGYDYQFYAVPQR